MTKYHLAKLIQWVGDLHTRKRMQKLVYVLQAAGCEFEADYFLHKYGPYSQEVARLADEMVAQNILEESKDPNAVGLQFSYKLTEYGTVMLEKFETNASGSVPELGRFEALAKDLASQDLRLLEVASTIVYYHCDKKQPWDAALQSACSFKSVSPTSPFARNSLDLAKKIEASPTG